MANLVVGAGVTGATIARRLAESGKQVLVIDERPHIAGNAYDYRDANGIMIHKYGSHIFHTNSAEVWKFLSRFTNFNTYMHQVLAVLDGIPAAIPFNLRTLRQVFPPSLAARLEEKLLAQFPYNTKIPILEFQKQNDDDLKFLARYVYEKVFLHYTAKQWGTEPTGVDGAVTARVPVYISCDGRYFQDIYQGIPTEGYTEMIRKILAHPYIEVRLNTRYTDIKHSFSRIFYTGAIDEFFEYKWGELPYRSVYFKLEEYNRPYYQQNAVINYPCNYDFTRIHEYKYYLRDSSPKTVIAKEYSTSFRRGENERYYPVPAPQNEQLYRKYLQEAAKLPNVCFAGRLGEYKYYDMDKAVARALATVKEFI